MDKSVKTQSNQNYAARCLKAEEFSCVKKKKNPLTGFQMQGFFCKLFRITPILPYAVRAIRVSFATQLSEMHPSPLFNTDLLMLC